MNQPKFKFGDKVSADNGNPFVIGSIYVDGTTYRYAHSEDALFSYQESKLELFEEVKNKKLFAYASEYGEVVLMTKDAQSIHCKARNCHFIRAREYDVEYPSKVEKNR